MYVFFWKTINFQSQWHSSPFTLDGHQFQNMEQYMMYRKATLFNDDEIANKILQTHDPRTIKALGRKVSGFDPAKWNAYKIDIVYTGNMAKFRQNPTLKQKLFQTIGKFNVEASPNDNIWGIGFSEANALANKPKWGQNHLGKILDIVRDELFCEGKTNISCGIFLIVQNYVLLTHATGSKKGTYGIPKGLKDVDETFEKAAMREFEEECGVATDEIFDYNEMDRIGLRKYPNQNKWLYAFKVVMNSNITLDDMPDFECQSFVDGTSKPEVDEFYWCPLDQLENKLYKSQRQFIPLL